MRLGIFHKSILLGMMLLLFITGGLWALSAYEVQLPFGVLGSDTGGRNFERETTLITLHGIGAMVYLMALGALFPVHISKGWSTKRKRRSGSSLVVLNGALVITAAFLYYGTPGGTRDLAGELHLWAGVALPLALLAHIWGQYSRNRARLQ